MEERPLMRANPLRYTLVLVTLLILFLSGCPKATKTATETKAEGFILTVLHTNDTHSHFAQFNKHGNTCGTEEIASGECFGGVARRAYMIDKIRGEESNVILVDAGDQFQGTLLYTLYRSEPAQTFMNELGYDAMTLGNHEFDDGPSELAEFAGGLNFPVVSSNVDFSNEPALKDIIKPYTILEVAGHEVGIIGLTTEDVPSISNPGPNVIFHDVQSSAKRAVDELSAKGVNIVIALTHIGFASDMELAGAVDGIDIIVGGHTHTLLSNTDKDAEGPYPVMASSPAGDPVLVVTAQSWGKYLGDLKVTFDAEGVVAEWSGDPILLDNSVPEDEDVAAEVEKMSGEVESLRNQVVGETAVDLTNPNELSRYEECALGDLITDAMLWETEGQGVQVALYNGGGLRTGIPKGPITMEEVLEVLPFFDTLATLGLKGSDLRQTLEYGVSRAESTQNEGTGRFLQVAGLSFTWDPNKPVGSRVTDVMVRNEEGAFVPLDDETVYKVAATDYLRSGGDGQVILAEKAIDPYDFGRAVSDILVDYLEKFSPVAPKVEGRIKKVE